MLQTLYIQNVALIEKQTITFGEKFNVLLGETGAGKSIIFDAINFVLGQKLDKNLLRSGEEQMRVDAMFDCLNQSTYDLLAEKNIEGEEIVLTRTYNANGKSSCLINGIPCSSNMLKEIGDILVDSASQHESIELLKTKNHLAMIDKYGAESIEEIKSSLKETYSQYNDILKQIKELGGNEFERERTMSLLEYQIKEIEDAELVAGEQEELQEKIKLLSNSEKIFDAISNCESILDGSANSTLSMLSQASHMLSGIDVEDILSCKERLEGARIEIEDIYETLLDVKDKCQYDEKEFERMDKRLDLIKSLCKKYGGSVEKVLEYYDEIKDKFDKLNDSEEILSKLNKKKDLLQEKLKDIADKLTGKRQETAKIIQEKMLLELEQLGMKSSRFEVRFSLLDDVSQNGQDEVEFVFSANKGQEIKSLSKTASGGELSRFMLAIKNIFAQIGSAQTLLFDEIDSGISGETGNVIGEKLGKITDFAQIICITHLPQVACHGDDFYLVSKSEDEKGTKTHIKHLADDEIIQNLAHITVGENVSQTSLKQAEEMRRKAGKIV